MTPEQQDAVEVAEALQSFYAAFEEGDLDRVGAAWLDGDRAADVSCVHPGWPVVRGRGPVLRSWAVVLAGTTYIQFFLTDLQVEVAGDVAVAVCAESILTDGAVAGAPTGRAPGDDTDPDPDGPGDDADPDEPVFGGSRCVSTNVLHRTPEGWRLLLRHASPVLGGTGETPSETPGGGA